MSTIIERLRALHEKATPGPWIDYGGDIVQATMGSTGEGPLDYYGDGKDVYEAGMEGLPISAANQALFIAMRNALPALLDRIVAAEVHIAAIEACPYDDNERGRWKAAVEASESGGEYRSGEGSDE